MHFALFGDANASPYVDYGCGGALGTHNLLMGLPVSKLPEGAEWTDEILC